MHRPDPQWHIVVDSWLSLPYPDWYINYFLAHFQPDAQPLPFLAAFSAAAAASRPAPKSPLLARGAPPAELPALHCMARRDAISVQVQRHYPCALLTMFSVGGSDNRVSLDHQTALTCNMSCDKP